MTKADIVREIAKKTGIDNATVLASVEAFMESVKESLAREDNVYLRGFGSFILKKRAQKTARNISKNTTIIIPSTTFPLSSPRRRSPIRSNNDSPKSLFDSSAAFRDLSSVFGDVASVNTCVYAGRSGTAVTELSFIASLISQR